ncbi:glycerophosphodiester phosphodiesterase [Phenylobacterium aquaticum]|uniref:glycerophosphodiester phosphodiesterase n=1 Tax=Phenylobacterium aquaticum TaxID=1763816 RepID=UPI0026F217CD|nr:glycerophosphodiester phosphodiesterase [Phenylobacterium aquaticum]
MPTHAAATPPKRPLVIAHRGASGLRPEHTRTGYLLAIAQGADFIEPDLVLTKDGHMVVRHENEIGGTTDVASHPEFAARKTRKMVDGEAIEGWFTEDFTLAELKTLRARERLGRLRPVSAAFDGTDPIPTFDEVWAIAKSESQRLGRTIGVYPEMKHPSYFAGIGMPFEARLAASLKAKGLDSRNAPVFVQCFEVGPLKTFATLSKAPRIQLVSAEGGPADDPKATYRDMTSATGMKTLATYADGVGPDWKMVVPVVDGALAPASSFVADAHAAGVAVHPWTVRAENQFLPTALRRGDDPAAHGDVAALYAALFAAGVDGLFSDFPGLEFEARARFMAGT